MAKAKEKVSKSSLIREILKDAPGMEPKDVVAKLAEQGHNISVNLVYGIKGGMKETKRRKKKIAKAAMAAVVKPSSNGQATPASKTDAITLIRDVKELVGRAGGYERLKELVDALAD